MRLQTSATSDMLPNAISSGMAMLANLPTEPESLMTSQPTMSAMRADRGSKIGATGVHASRARTLRNR